MEQTLKPRQIAATLAILWLGHFTIDFMIGIFSIYKTISGLDLATAGLIAGSAALIGEGMQLFFGPYGDRGWRKVFIAISFIFAFGSLLLSYTNSEMALFFCFMATCIGSGAFHPSAASMVSNIAFKRNGLYLAIFTSGGTLGMALSHLIYAKAHLVLDGQTLWLAPLLLLLIILSSLLLKESTPAPNLQAAPRASVGSFKQCLQNQDLRALYFALVCNQTVFWTLLFLLPDLLVSRNYPSWICFGGGHLTMISGTFAMLIPIGYLSDRSSPKIVKRVLLIAGTFFFYLLLGFPRLPEQVLLAVLFCLGSCIGAFNPIGLSWGNRILPRQPGVVNALLMGSVWMISESLGPSLCGLLTKAFSSDAPAKALMIFGSALFISLYFISTIPDPRLKVSPQYGQ